HFQELRVDLHLPGTLDEYHRNVDRTCGVPLREFALRAHIEVLRLGVLLQGLERLDRPCLLDRHWINSSFRVCATILAAIERAGNSIPTRLFRFPPPAGAFGARRDQGAGFP